MPTVELIRGLDTEAALAKNPLPDLLHTPLGLAIIEIQGTIHAPSTEDSATNDDTEQTPLGTHIGRLEFPLYDGSTAEGPWMKSVHLYVGKHQRLTGEVKKLAKPLMVLSKPKIQEQSVVDDTISQLSIDAVIRHKILFSSRPEPVGG